ncbi:MAG: replication/maintenance protein RepL [Oscillospiraceae bacterium]|jgi:hypothetical protein|nr:replication/maintenance protein RepL [Oscillospiraceae bacterium]
MQKANVVETRKTVDEDGRESVVYSNRWYRVKQEPPYIKLYLSGIEYMRDLPGSYYPVLMALLKRLPWAGHERTMVINAGVKRMVAKEAGCSVGLVNNAMTVFVKGKVLFRLERGVYAVNPFLFGKGEWIEVDKLRKEQSAFEAGGNSVMSEVRKNGAPGMQRIVMYREDSENGEKEEQG